MKRSIQTLVRGAFLLIFTAQLASFSGAEVPKVCCKCAVGNGVTSSGQCWDGSACTPCCGWWSCNWLCCNCSGGCRCGNGPFCNTRQDSSGVSERFAFSGPQTSGVGDLDLNGDGSIDKDEVKLYLESGACGNASEKMANFDSEFKSLDRDGDGVLSYNEVNS